MSAAGYYKRRRGILEHLESGTIGLLDLAVHDYLCLKMNTLLGNGCSVPAGVCITSAAAIHAICPKEVSERTIRRSLEHLEQIGWIKRWTVPGKHGNYPVLVARAGVRDLSGNEYRVNAEKTRDWRFPVCEPASSARGGGEEVSGLKEVKKERAKKSGAALPRSPFWELIGVKPETLPAAFAELCDGLYATRGDQSLFDFMGVCMDAWESQGNKIPRAFARAKAALRNTPAPAEPFPVAETEDWGAIANYRAGVR